MKGPQCSGLSAVPSGRVSGTRGRRGVDAVCTTQLEYYRARASEYDQWWLRQGRYDRCAELNARWFADAVAARAALQEFRPRGHVLELACGTGLWTEHLLPFAESLTAMDGSAEMLAVGASRVPSGAVEFLQADLFQWVPSRRYDTIFFGFWLSHVPPSRFDAFWHLIDRALAPGGRVFFIDSRHNPTSTANDHRLPPSDAITLSRRLDDGREFTIYKVFYEPAALAAQLLAVGWRFDISTTERYFVVGTGQRRQV